MPTPARLAIIATLFLAGAWSCDGPMPSDPGDSHAVLAKASSSDPVVSSADPAAAERDTTLNVRVLGSGFDTGSRAEFLLNGVAMPGVTTNSTTYRSSRELVANITIAADAVPERYDIQVTTSRGKKGIGTEKFQVLDVLDLGTLGGQGGRATALNGVGQVVGQVTRTDGKMAPFVWADGLMQELPTSSGWASGLIEDINDAGVVVGSGNDGTRSLPLRWTEIDGNWVVDVLPTLPGYEGGSGHALSINEAGEIAGSVSQVGLPGRLVLWRNGQVYAVNLTGAGLSGNSIAVEKITEAGWMAGSANFNMLRSSFVWRPDGSGVPGQGITILLPRMGTSVNAARGMNETGTVVGYIMTSKSTTAVRWRPLRPEPLATSDYVVEALPGTGAYAWDVGDDGFIVGQQGEAAVSWTAGGALGLLPVLQRAKGMGAAVEVVEGRHWVAGESAVGGYWRATLWRVP
jgi:probable HAF family extracellular repeat protein